MSLKLEAMAEAPPTGKLSACICVPESARGYRCVSDFQRERRVTESGRRGGVDERLLRCGAGLQPASAAAERRCVREEGDTIRQLLWERFLDRTIPRKGAGLKGWNGLSTLSLSKQLNILPHKYIIT